MVRQLGTKEEFNEVVKNSGNKTVFVDFTATWCGPCKMIGPFFEELAGMYPDMIFVKVDVDENEDVAAEAEVKAMPTFQVYQHGTRIEVMVGADKQKLKDLCAKYCASTKS